MDLHPNEEASEDETNPPVLAAGKPKGGVGADRAVERVVVFNGAKGEAEVIALPSLGVADLNCQ